MIVEEIDMGWADSAACKGEDPNLFHPDRGESTAPAKAVCAECPVKADCLAHALKHEQLGIWGGTSERQRRRLRKAAGIKIERPQAFADIWAGVFSEDQPSDLEEASGW